jgi:hypothetical protein
MATETFRFQTEQEATAFETGALFFWDLPPYATELNGTTLTIRNDFGDEITVHDYRWSDVSGTPSDLGDSPLVSKIRFPTADEARAFAYGLSWFCGAFVGVDVFGTTVTVKERREEGDESGKLIYDFEQLHSLIRNYRANIHTDSASA